MPRSDTFVRSISDGALVRLVQTRQGGRYRHVCTKQTYLRVAYGVERRSSQGTTVDELRRELDLPMSQVAVAIAFMDERGVIEKVRRRIFPASSFAAEDAMVELHALGMVRA